MVSNPSSSGPTAGGGRESEQDRYEQPTVRAEGRTVERVVLTPLLAGDAADGLAAARDAVTVRSGGILRGPEIGSICCGRPHNHDTVFTIRRHSTADDDDYCRLS